MFVKLIGYEMKAFSRILLPLYGILIVLAALAGLSVNSNNTVALAAVSALYFTLTVGVGVVTLVLIVGRFLRNLLGDEGYLMFSLPTSTGNLIWSKITASVIWITLGMAAIFLAVGVAGLTSGDDILQGLFRSFNRLGMSTGDIVLFIVAYILGFAVIVTKIYAAFSIGQIFMNHRFLIGVLIYIGFEVAEFVLRTVLDIPKLRQNVLGLSYYMIYDYFTQDNTLLYLLAQCILLAVYGTISWYFLDKKLNLR